MNQDEIVAPANFQEAAQVSGSSENRYQRDQVLGSIAGIREQVSWKES